MGITDRLASFAAARSWSVYQRVNCVTTRRLGSRTIRIPLRFGLGLANLTHDTRELERALAACPSRPGAWFVDIGANVGQSLLTLLLGGWAANYIGFEPDLDAAGYVAELIKANGLTGAAILPVALGPEQGVAVLRTAERAWSGSTLDRAHSPDQMYNSEVRVALTTGDVQLAHIPDDDFLLIKMDVEGFERSVLDGLADTVRRARPPLYIEVLGYDHFLDGSYSRTYFGELKREQIDQLVEARTANGAAVERWLRERNYDLFMMSTGAATRIDRLDLGASRPGRQGEYNVLALPSG